MRSLTALVILFLFVAPSLTAQKVAPPPTRPHIQELADTNDARAYSMTSGDLYDYFDWNQKKRKPEYLAIDSLLYRAYTVNPFVYRNKEVPLIRAIIEADVIKDDPGVDRAELGHQVLEAYDEDAKAGVALVRGGAASKVGDEGYYRISAITSPEVAAASGAFAKAQSILATR